MNPITISWLAEVGIITWRSVKNNSRAPLPSELLATFIVFGGLSLVGNNSEARKPAGIAAAGFVVATLLNFFDPTFSTTGGNPTSPSGVNGSIPQSVTKGQ